MPSGGSGFLWLQHEKRGKSAKRTHIITSGGDEPRQQQECGGAFTLAACTLSHSHSLSLTFVKTLYLMVQSCSGGGGGGGGVGGEREKMRSSRAETASQPASRCLILSESDERREERRRGRNRGEGADDSRK